MATTSCTGDQYIEFIEQTECIGDSLEKINSNFGIMDSVICETKTMFDSMATNEGLIFSNGDSTFRSAKNGPNAQFDYYKPGDSLDELNITGGLSVGSQIVANAGLYSLTDIKSKGDIIAFASSDERLKKNINVITNPLIKLQEIKGVQFTWDSELQSSYEGDDVGVLAQDVQKVQPECVTERDNGYLAVKYEKLIPLLIESIKELKAEVDELRRQTTSGL